MKSKNVKVLTSFVKYCEENPEMRFWQALRNWAREDFILAQSLNRKTGENVSRDTFYWEGKNK